MEKIEKNFFYLGIEEGAVLTSKSKVRRQGCAIRKLNRKMTFSGGSLQIYYALLPEFEKKALFLQKRKIWKAEHLRNAVDVTLDRAKKEWDCREAVICTQLSREGCEVPIELVDAYLRCFVPFEQVCVSFSEEGGAYEAREAILLLAPYLRRMRQVILAGEQCPASELLFEYLYYEFGLMLSEQKAVPERTPWLDFSDGERKAERLMGSREEIWRINKAETLKFLDTTVKNGYNTES